MRTLVHAGFHKTGTTALQAFLSGSTAWLAERGVDYPVAGRGDAQAHHALACACAGERDTPGPNDLFVPERRDYCRRCHVEWISPPADGAGIGTRLYSSEIFSTFDAVELQRLHSRLGRIDRFILYRRGGIDYLYSCWATKIRWGATVSFREFLVDCIDGLPGTPIAGALACIGTVAGTVGRDCVEVRSYEAACRHAGGIVGAFVEHVLGLAAVPPSMVPAPMNPTPSPELVELTRALQLVCTDGTGTRLYPRLKAAIRSDPDARGVVDRLCALIAPRMQALSIAAMGRPASVLDIDGRVRASPGTDLIGNWVFPPRDDRPGMDTPELLDAMAASPEFDDLLALLRTPA